MKLAFDTETHGLDWWDGQGPFLISWATDSDQGVFEVFTDNHDEKELAAFAERVLNATEIIAHNLPFDTHQLREFTGIDLLETDAALHDTNILARIVNPYKTGFGDYRLKELSATFVNPESKDEQDEMKALAEQISVSLTTAGGYYDLWRAYPKVVEKYAIQDARITYDLHEWLLPQLDPATNAKTYELERAIMPIIIRSEQRGLAVDKPVATQLHEEYLAKREALADQLDETLGRDALSGPGSEAALLKVLTEDLGVPLYRKTPKGGKLSTNKFALAEFEDEFPVIGDLLEYRRLDKFIGTYLEPMAGRDIVHTNFLQCEARTGRMSSRRPNVQNLPKRAGREARRPIAAPEGRKLVSIDFDGIEARLLAFYMNDPDYKRLVVEDDPHAWMASMIHGGEPSMYKKGTDGEDQRNAAKNTLFAITYGAGAPRVADMNGISKAAAKDLIAQIKNSLPKYRKLQGRVKKKIQYQGYITTIGGRRQYVAKDKAYVALNALIQGSAADLMKQAVINVQKELDAHDHLDAHMVLFVHDEIVLDCPSQHADQVLALASTAMEAAGKDVDPPLAVSGGIGQNYEEV